MRRLLILALTVVALANCRSEKPDETMTDPPAQTANASDADEVSGVAQNAKGGAVILTEDGRVVYVLDLEAWPEELLNQEVVATGELEQTDYIPDPVVDDSGAISAGAAGDEWVLRDAQWSAE